MMRQTTLDEPTSEHDRECAIERLGWRRLPDEYGATVWRRNDTERLVAPEDLSAWLASGCPEQAEPGVLAVEAAIRDNAPITRRKLKALLAKSFDVSGLAETLAEMIDEGFVEETPDGYVLEDRI